MKLSAIALAIAGLALGPASASATIIAESYSFDVIGLTTSSGTASPDPDQHGSFSFRYDDADPSSATLTDIYYPYRGIFGFSIESAGISRLGPLWSLYGSISPLGTVSFSLVFSNNPSGPTVTSFYLDTSGFFSHVHYDVYQEAAIILISREVLPEPAGPTPAVPEPATWAMMIVGFGMIGGAMRRRASGGISLRGGQS